MVLGRGKFSGASRGKLVKIRENYKKNNDKRVLKTYLKKVVCDFYQLTLAILSIVALSILNTPSLYNS